MPPTSNRKTVLGNARTNNRRIKSPSSSPITQKLFKKRTRVDVSPTVRLQERPKRGLSKEIRKYYGEVTKAHKFGSLTLKKHGLGMPRKKFTPRDIDKYGVTETGDDQWPAQAIYSGEKSKKLLLVYEGWTADCGQWQTLSELKGTAGELIEIWRKRQKIATSISSKMKAEGKQSELFSGFEMRDDPSSIFWCYEDLFYFISESNKRANHEKVFFFMLKECDNAFSERKFPSGLKFLLKNEISEDARKEVESNEKMYSFYKGKYHRGNKRHQKVEACPSENCRCLTEFTIRYRRLEHQKINYTKEGLLDFTDYEEKLKIVMECSDDCGCTAESCPSRRMQNGTQVFLAVVLGKELGFELRAGENIKKGQFIIEYVGLLKTSIENQNLNTYVMAVHTMAKDMMIDGAYHGSISRYINHSCDPNAEFLEVHSREKETDPLYPRVGIYAIKDIAQGEQITAHYFGLDDPAVEYAKMDCLCRAANCIKKIPDISAI